jgi:hypothetical protein
MTSIYDFYADCVKSSCFDDIDIWHYFMPIASNHLVLITSIYDTILCQLRQIILFWWHRYVTLFYANCVKSSCFDDIDVWHYFVPSASNHLVLMTSIYDTILCQLRQIILFWWHRYVTLFYPNCVKSSCFDDIDIWRYFILIASNPYFTRRFMAFLNIITKFCRPKQLRPSTTHYMPGPFDLLWTE